MSEPEPERCPQCGGDSLSFGYGFAGGGGIGEYTFCLDCDCLTTKHVTEPGSCLHEPVPGERRDP